MSSYIKILGEAVAPGQASNVTSLVKTTPKALSVGKMPVGVGSALLAGGSSYVGYRLWKHKHPVLGALAGLSVGFNAPNVVRGDAAARKDALVGLGVTGAAVGASLAWKKHPAWGYVLGGIGASILSVYVPDSPMARFAVEAHQQRLADEQAQRLGLPATAAAKAA